MFCKICSMRQFYHTLSVNRKVTCLGETLLNINCDIKTTLFYKKEKIKYVCNYL